MTKTLHETQFLMFDSKGELEKQTTHDAITSPFYFAANLMEQTNQTTNGFYQLLLSLEQNFRRLNENCTIKTDSGIKKRNSIARNKRFTTNIN